MFNMRAAGRYIQQCSPSLPLPLHLRPAPNTSPPFCLQALLPRQTRQCPRKTLVLDLDETLVHSSLEPVADPDFTFPVHFNSMDHMVHVRVRPHMQVGTSRTWPLAPGYSTASGLGSTHCRALRASCCAT
jgi:hypothetical protein